MILSHIQVNPFLFFFLFHLNVVHSRIQNVTIDDAAATGVIPVYLPSPNWTQGATCPGCGAQPDPSFAFDRTWHDATFTPSDGIAKAIEFTFTGTAVYVFFILANTIEFVDTVTNMNFIIDEAPVGNFLHNPSSSTDYQYNVPVYVNESIPAGQHLIQMEATGNHSALILFDYLVYSFDSDEASATISSVVIPISSQTTTPETQQSGTSLSIGPIIGAIVAGITSIAALLGAILLYQKRKRRQQASRPDRIMTQHIPGNRASLSSSAPGDIAVGILNLSQNAPTSFNNDGIPTRQRRSLPKTSTPHETEELLLDNRPRLSFKDKHTSRSRPTQSPVDTSIQGSSRNPESDTVILRGQVEYLMDEVVRLRNLQLDNRGGLETVSEAPPDYSEGRASPEP